jgi:hypothetical protein
MQTQTVRGPRMLFVSAKMKWKTENLTVGPNVLFGQSKNKVAVYK